MNIKKIIREEIEDFTWITDTPLNPWLEYDAIIFDKKPKKKKVNNYIQLALNTKNPSNKGSWETRRKEDIESILRYIKNYGESVLMVDGNNNLVYADPSYYDGKTINSIKYSQLVNKNLNESEEDEWSWARNSFISSNEIKVGSKIRIHNLGDEESFLSWLADYRGRFLHKKYGDQIEGVVQHISRWNFSLDTKDDTIYFPSDEKMEGYKNLHIGYELI